MKNLGLISIATSSVLVLSGCGGIYPNIYEFAEPTNMCGTAEVFLSIDEKYPILNTEDQTIVELNVTDAAGNDVSPEVFNSLEIEYRIGIFNSTGFRDLPLLGISSRSIYSPETSPTPEPLPTRDAFLDLFWDTTGPSPSPTPSDSSSPAPFEDGEFFFPVTSTEQTIRGSLSEILEFPDLWAEEQDNYGAFLEFQALLGTLPGVFLAKCKLQGYEANPYVAAAQIFPNTSLFDFEPEAQLEETQNFPMDQEVSDAIVLYMPGKIQNVNGFIQGIGLIREVDSSSFSDEAATERWLRTFSGNSFDEETASEFNFGDFYDEINQDISNTTVRSQPIQPLDPGDYQMLLLYWDLENLDTELIIDGFLSDQNLAELILYSGATHYDLNVSSSGVYTFTLIEAPLTKARRSASSSGRGMASIDPGQQTIVSSTKGFRSATISGSNLDLVSAATVGGKSATVAAKSLTSMSLSLPAQKAGSHDLVLSHNSGTIVKQDMVRYYKSKLIKDQRVEASAPKSQWLADFGKTIRATPKAVQVNCAVSVPEGKAGRALVEKARAVCAEVSKIKPALKAKVVVKKIADGATPSLNIRYWN